MPALAWLALRVLFGAGAAAVLGAAILATQLSLRAACLAGGRHGAPPRDT